MRAVIFDDDSIFAKNLLIEFKNYFGRFMKPIEVEVIATNFSLDISIKADVAFIDIDLNGKNGITLAKYIKDISPKTLIIFVSSKEELVFNALSVSTFQFIRKSKFKEDSVRVFKQLNQYIQEQDKKIVLEIDGRKNVIKASEIQFILSFGRDLLIKTCLKEFVFVSSIRRFLEILEAVRYYDLVQISRNQAINMNYISSIKTSTVIMIDGSTHTVGRKYKTELISTYEEFLLK